MLCRDWQEAVDASPYRKAIGRIHGRVIDRQGKPQEGEFLMDGRTRSPVIVLKHSFIKIDDATAAQVDACNEWRPLI